MGTVTFTFMGICTHFMKPFDLQLPGGVAHRVVLVNASNISAPIDDQVIPPHFASMTIPATTLTSNATLGLNGVTVTVQNPASAAISYTSNFNLVPNLTSLMGAAGQELGFSSPAVVLGYNSALAAAYFDFGSGATVDGCSNMGAIATSVTVTTTDPDSEPVVVLLTPFAPSPWPAPVPQTLTVPSNTTLSVQNVSFSETNATYHFYLNYLTALQMPSDPQLPGDITMQGCNGRTFVAGPGCSNTNYP